MQVAVTKEYSKIECKECGCDFFVSAQQKQQYIETSRYFWCPNGHQQAFTASLVDMLREKLEIEQSNRVGAEMELAKSEINLEEVKRRLSKYVKSKKT